jgi:hypothetical protein
MCQPACYPRRCIRHFAAALLASTARFGALPHRFVTLAKTFDTAHALQMSAQTPVSTFFHDWQRAGAATRTLSRYSPHSH